LVKPCFSAKRRALKQPKTYLYSTNSGINTGIVVSTYPTKEHNDLLKSGKPGTLRTSLGFRNALTMKFKGHRNARVAKVEWKEFYLHLLPLVIEHPKLLMTGGKDKVTQTINKLFEPSAQFIGDASLNVELQNTMKVKSLCLPILADNPERRLTHHGDRTRRLRHLRRTGRSR
jgi:hypothetical protein